MSDIKPNSHKYKAAEKQHEKQPEKQIEKVVNGTVKTRKKSEMRKFKDAIVSDDATNVGSYLLMDVLLPAVKKAVVDIVTDGVNMIFFGEKGRSKTSGSRSSYVSYGQSSRDTRDRFATSSRGGYNPDDIILEQRREAEEVLLRMDELIDLYGHVSVADLYDLVGKTGDYTDNKYGWTNVRNAEPVRIRDGYILKLPRAIPIS